jgi:HAE1 family hydrophobic/amphiphilic exporter-1
LRAEGKGIFEAAVEGARLRFRPILMTSFAFILGVFPLVIADGAGAAGQRALGTAVFGGMIASTFLSVFFVPVLLVLLQAINEWWKPLTPVAVTEEAQALTSEVTVGQPTNGQYEMDEEHAQPNTPHTIAREKARSAAK